MKVVATQFLVEKGGERVYLNEYLNFWRISHGMLVFFYTQKILKIKRYKSVKSIEFVFSSCLLWSEYVLSRSIFSGGGGAQVLWWGDGGGGSLCMHTVIMTWYEF